MIESIALSILASLLGGLITYTIIKKAFGTNYILEISYELIDEVTSNTEFQKKLYLVGVLVGNGIKAGIGLPKGKGKFKMEDLVGMGLSFLFGGSKKEGKESTLPFLDWQNLNK